MKPVTVEAQVCKLCDTLKPAEEFSRNHTMRTGLDRRCKACVRLLTQVRRGGLDTLTTLKRAAPEGQSWCNRCKRYVSAEDFHRNDACCVPCRAAAKRAYHQRRYATDPEYRRVYNQRHYLKSKPKWRQHRHIRRARMVAAAGTFSVQELEARMAYFGHRCIYCGTEDDLSVEHLIPLSRGGTNWPANLAPSCLTCNKKKGVKTHMEYTKHSQGGACPVR